MDLTVTVDDTGDLVLAADAETRQYIAEERAERDFWTVLHQITEGYWTNGSFTPFDAGQANPFVGLTSTVCIAESMDARDSGENVIVGRLWFFEDWTMQDPLDQLQEHGKTMFKLAG